MGCKISQTEDVEEIDRTPMNLSRKRGRDKRYIEGVICIPHTPNSSLKNNLTKMESKLGFKTRVRYTEELGNTVASMLCKKDPNPQHCGRQNCFPCKGEKQGMCQRQGVIYYMECLECREQGKKTLYVGESSRSGYDRGVEHLRAVEADSEESPLVEHRNLKHQYKAVRFEMILKEFPRTTLQRQ